MAGEPTWRRATRSRRPCGASSPWWGGAEFDLHVGAEGRAGIRDSLKKLASSPRPGFARLAEDLGRSAAAAFATLPEKPRDAEALYLQLMEAGLPDPARIMAERMDAAAITKGRLAGLTECEHRAPETQALFRRLTQPATPTGSAMVAKGWRHRHDVLCGAQRTFDGKRL